MLMICVHEEFKNNKKRKRLTLSDVNRQYRVALLFYLNLLITKHIQKNLQFANVS